MLYNASSIDIDSLKRMFSPLSNLFFLASHTAIADGSYFLPWIVNTVTVFLIWA